jgi:ubiquinone/menaquinone biosynthesis C-methylase UbiE
MRDFCCCHKTCSNLWYTLCMAHKSTIDAYNKIADDFHKRNAMGILNKEYDIFKQLMGEGKNIIEIGCGTGRDAENLIKRGFDYIGIDASEEMLKIAHQQVPGATFEVGDFYKLNFSDEIFDGFWAAATFLHVPKSEIDVVITEVKRILKSHAKGFISVKEKTTMEEGIIKEEKGGGIQRFFAFYDQDEFEKILHRNGFAVIRTMRQQENDNIKTRWVEFFVEKLT